MMDSPQLFLCELKSDLENRVYNVKLGNNQTIKVHVRQDFAISAGSKGEKEIREILRVNCPEITFISPYSLNLDTYYPHKTLDQKMERAALEYGGTIDDMHSGGC